MKINVFGKEIEFDENNPGIKYFLEECCEFPDENWIATEYERQNNIDLPENCYEIMKDLDKKDILNLMKNGILESIEFIEKGNHKDLSQEKDYVCLAFQ